MADTHCSDSIDTLGAVRMVITLGIVSTVLEQSIEVQAPEREVVSRSNENLLTGSLLD